MSDATYKASLSKSQGRGGWSIIFRHPVRVDPVTGKPGRRVRRGLATRDLEQAGRLVADMNSLLADPTFRELSARSRAERRFDPKVVEIFYDDLVPEGVDFHAVRNDLLPLPSSSSSECRRVLLIGTTGGGKTTLVRQFLGTHPTAERFPSTSTAKTTVADMEFILTESLFRAVVTFLPRDQVMDYVEECVSAAVLAAYQEASEEEILRRLLNHVSQRFRLSYILGTGGQPPGEEDVDDEDEGLPDAVTAPDIAGDLEDTSLLLKDMPKRVRALGHKHGESLRAELLQSADDERVIEEIFEEYLDHLLRDDEDFHAISDDLMEAIERRFEFLTVGKLQKTKQGWPRAWQWDTEKRDEFIQVVSRFTSNYAPYFGSLLTPLVNGIRVAGPFIPEWLDRRPPLAILDGEGLGHTPESSLSLPTLITRRFDEVDAILLVDNATQPMQASAVAVLKGVAASGKSSKLLFCFTHFDDVKGDNLPTFRAKEQHVLASAENVLPAIGEELGPFAERALRKRLQLGCFFVGGIHERLDSTSKRGARTVGQLSRMLESIDAIIERPAPARTTAVYDLMNLVLVVREATEAFHDKWRARLGHHYRSDIVKSHWATVKALSRRVAEGWADEWANLRPVADLHAELENKIYVFIQNPLAWEPMEPTDDEKQDIFDRFAAAISQRALDIAARRIRYERVPAWQDAYNKRGPGSTFVRASIIQERVYEEAAPIPSSAPSPDRNRFLHEVLEAVREAGEACDVKLR